MKRGSSAFNRREALQHIGIIGVGAVVSACGNGGGGGSASPTATTVPTASPTSAPSSTSSPTVAATGLPTSTVSPTAAPSNTSSPPASATGTQSGTATPIEVSCILTPEQTLGPYFIDVGLARNDIREDRAGIPLRLAIRLVDVDDGCAPIRDAVVNVWHADAAGVYSGFAGQPGGIDTRGETFLRGFQVTDADGRIEFTTIYPGWYTGRTVHIHVRIHLDSTTVLVSQLYSSDALTAVVHTQAPYASHGQPDTTNATDSIARNGLDDLLLDVVAEDGGYAGSIVLGVAGA